MPELRFVSLECHRTDDSGEVDDQAFDIGLTDEPYLLVDHKRVWGRRMNAGEIEDLGKVKPIQFNNKLTVELWDKDAGYMSADDQIGRITIFAAQSGQGDLSHEFKRRNARYTLVYKVE
jgi:hypothetical protein